MSKPLVTAIIPTYRRPDVVHRSGRSVFAQTYRPLECIVIDDGSGDETMSVLAGFVDEAREAGVDYRYVEKENAGAGAARSKGMELAKGEFFAFLDDDDEWLPEKTTKQLAAFEAQPEAGASFTQYFHGQIGTTAKPRESRLTDGWCFESLCDGGTGVHQQCFVIRRSLFEQVGAYADYYNFQDFEYFIRCALFTPFVAVREPLVLIHTHESSISRSAGLAGDIKRDQLKLRVLSDFATKWSEHERYSADAMKVCRARIYDEYVKHLLWDGQVFQAKKIWQQALNECGQLPILLKLKSKLRKGTLLGIFGKKLRKPE
ncbi:MAG: glycosyltransferase family 2 protein [Planctomycetes bacterium]|nr:glycosyltransferase family 2 protein [Planctomycetota bacterium]